MATEKKEEYYKFDKEKDNNEEFIRQIIREELADFLSIDKFIFKKHIQIFNGKNIQIGRGTGTKIATATDQKLAIHGSTPVIQRAGAAQAAAGTTGATNTTPYGYTSAAQANAIVALVNELRAALVEKGIIKGSA